MRHGFRCLAAASSLVLGVALLEIVAYAILPSLGERQGRLFLLPFEPRRCDLDAVDVFFGFAPGECETPPEISLVGGLAIMSDPEAPVGKTVLVLGGSTTDPIALAKSPDLGFDGWARLLAQRCQEALPGCRVVNGGRAAFTSAQELLLLVRDGLAFDPDVVVSLNGINEWYFRDDPHLAEHPFVTRHQRITFRNMCHGISPYAVARWRRVMPNATALAIHLRKQFGWALPNSVVEDSVDGRIGDCLLNLGPALPDALQDPATIWRRNVTSMEALVRAQGGRYFVALQPTLGVGRHAPGSGRDAELLDETRQNESRYLTIMAEIYLDLQRECAQLAYCIDLTDLFVGETDVYADPRHPNRKGNALEAAAIWSLIAPHLVEPSSE